MGHRPQHSDGVISQQARVNAEALRRASARNAGPQPASDDSIDPGVAIAAGIERRDRAQDAVLNWAGGVNRSTVGRSDIPLSSELSRVAGVSADPVTSDRSMDPFIDHTGGRK
jgi:hypothetical protein